jgi:Ca-activated chloride channel family protein
MQSAFTASLVLLAAGALLNPTLLAQRILPARQPGKLTQGTLWMVEMGGRTMNACPLKRTEVKAEISGPVAQVTVTQRFSNPTQETIEAVYQFPLPHDAAVEDMTMRLEDRTVRAQIQRKEEARRIYEAARNRGQVAGLLEQERPNVFTQSVANITPGAQVDIVIRYVQRMPYEAGQYAFVFPMVVGPRYNPKHQAAPVEQSLTPEGTRAGHDITLEVKLNSGIPLKRLDVPTHAVEVARGGPTLAVIRLKNESTIPNKDFVLNYTVAAPRIGDALMAHTDSRGGYFSFVLEPPSAVAPEAITPKEIVFVIDTSGSMHGFPLEKVKETMRLALEGLHPEDTFNVISFSGDNHVLWTEPLPATRENVSRAWQFVESRRASGGTEMMGAIRAALVPSHSQKHLRIVCVMTDGLVGNDLEILGEIQKYSNARVFSFGIGSATNRFLLDNMARVGRGEVEYVGLNDDGSAAAKRFHERVRTPLLTDIQLEWVGVRVDEVYPKQIPDLFSARPVIISGRYSGAQQGKLLLKGKLGGRLFTREIAVNLPASEPSHEALAPLWARAKVEHLMASDYAGMFRNTPKPEVRDAITRLGLDYRILTQYTSFVAVEERVVTEGGKPRNVVVPVEMPEGMSYEGVFNRRDLPQGMANAPAAGGVVGGVIGVASRTAEEPRWREKGQAAPPPVRSKPAETGRHAPKLEARLQGLPAGLTVEVEILLTDASPAVLAKLRALGVETVATLHSKKRVAARVKSDQLTALAQLDEVVAVQWIRPVE